MFTQKKDDDGDRLSLPMHFSPDNKGTIRVLANGPGDLSSIPSHVIAKTIKMVIDTFLLNTQQYKVRIEGKMEQSRERSNDLSYTSGKREPSGHPRLRSLTFYFYQKQWLH